MKYRLYLNLLLLVMAISLYQNCSNSGKVDFSSNQKPTIITSTTQQGNGDSFDGKPHPGDYVRTFPETQCPTSQNILLQSTMSVNETSADLTNDNCVATSFSVPFSNSALSSKIYNPEFLIYQSGIFEKSTLVVANEFTEAFCRYSQNDLGLDIVIKNNKSNNQRRSTIYIGRISAGQIAAEKSQAIAINLSEQDSVSVYSSPALDFNLAVSKNSVDEIVYSAKLTTTINERPYSLNLDCRRMNERPVLSVSPNSLLAYWKMDDNNATNGSTIISTVGLNGTLNTNDLINKSILGRIGGALGLDGADDFISVNTTNNATYNAADQMTITGWFNRNVPDFNHPIITKRNVIDGMPGNAGFSLNINDGDDRLFFVVDDGTNTFYFDSLTEFTAAGWNHFAVVFDRQSSSECRIYVNGVENTAQRYNDLTLLGAVSNNLNINLGHSSSNAYFFNGALDDISYWHRKLSSEEIRVLYQSNNPIIP